MISLATITIVVSIQDRIDTINFELLAYRLLQLAYLLTSFILHPTVAVTG